MPVRVDPEGVELNALRRVAPWREAEVLEIGCGDGRLTRRLARLGSSIVAIDPDRESIRLARASLPKSFSGRVRYAVGSSGRLKFPARSFDIVVFAWSL
jgi:2-polyprenyl-3-methyl-5-hydroxy-6-metoxy-1,4-benzoquinol methylase